jgi:hypothetical protein
MQTPACTTCHATAGTHDFLEDFAAHTAKLSCEACHVPAQYGAPVAAIDHTVLAPDGGPVFRYRGVEGDPASPKTLARGYRPVLLPRADAAGETKLAPFNLITRWAWFDGDREVDPDTLARAFLVDGKPHPAVLSALDATGDGDLTDLERAIFSPHQVHALAARLGEVGVVQPEIRGTIERVALRHGIAEGKWATRDCGACHGSEAPVTGEFWLADSAPAGILPEPVEGSLLAGDISLSECGHVVFHPDPARAGFDLEGTGPGGGPGRMLRLALAAVVALIALSFGTGPVLRTFRRKNTHSTEGTR